MRAVGRTVFIPGFLCLEECPMQKGKGTNTVLQQQISTLIISGPIFLIFLNGIIYSGSLPNKEENLFLPGIMTLHIWPEHSSNSRSPIFPRHLQSFRLMTSLHFNSEKSIIPHPEYTYHSICMRRDN